MRRQISFSPSRTPGASISIRTTGKGPPSSGRTVQVFIAPSCVAISSARSIMAGRYRAPAPWSITAPHLRVEEWNAMSGALEGLKVIDLSRVLGGPYCGQMLADHGAEVIKIEPPQGDEPRLWGPPFDAEGISAYFAGINRNKRTIALDLSN